MNLRRRINIWVITYCALILLIGVFSVWLSYFVNLEIEAYNQNPVKEIPYYDRFDNEIRQDTYLLKARDYDEFIYLNGFVTNIEDSTNAIAELNIDYKFYKDIEIGDTLELVSLFGNVTAEIIDIANEVNNNSVKITVQFNNDDLQLLKGTEVNSAIIFKHHTNAIIIPNNFIYEVGELRCVYVLNDKKTDYKHVFIEVKHLFEEEDMSVIVGDVYTGDEIVEIN